MSGALVRERPKDRIDRVSAELNRLGDHFRNLAGRTVPTVEWRGTFHFPREVIAREAGGRSCDHCFTFGS